MNKDKVILVDRRANAVGLRNYLDAYSEDLANIPILQTSDLEKSRGEFAGVSYIFGTWNMPTLSEKDIENYFPLLKAVFYAAGDTSYFVQPYLNRGVKVFDARRENSVPVVEFSLAQIILANKGYFQAVDIYRKGFWRWGFRRAREHSKDKPGNYGATIGIIGFGEIGSRLAERLTSFDLKVLVYDPFVDETKVKHIGAERVSLRHLFECSDVISNHLPDIPETRCLLGYELFSAMKRTATFINTGRGRQVDEKGLVRAMRDFPTRSALLDVTCREPPGPFSRLYRTPNIFLTPHIAGSQGNEIIRLYNAARAYYLELKNRD